MLPILTTLFAVCVCLEPYDLYPNLQNLLMPFIFSISVDYLQFRGIQGLLTFVYLGCFHAYILCYLYTLIKTS